MMRPILRRAAVALAALALPAAAACSVSVQRVTTDATSSRPAADSVAALIPALFAALGSADTARVREPVTPDFYFFEHGRYTADTLLAWMGQVKGWRWTQDQMDVEQAGGRALVTYRNTSSSGGTPREWLESVVAVRKGGRWRIAFLHSTRMTR